jgi:hypothetical protein
VVTWQGVPFRTELAGGTSLALYRCVVADASKIVGRCILAVAAKIATVPSLDDRLTSSRPAIHGATFSKIKITVEQSKSHAGWPKTILLVRDH